MTLVMSDPLVSVALPFFNAKATLKRAIESIINQSYRNIEFILIDNNSNDGSDKIAKLFQSLDDRIKLLQESKQGVAHAINMGIRQATGEYIARMDADDECPEDRLQHQVALLEKEQDVGLVSGLINYNGLNSNEGFVRYVNWINAIKSDKEIHINQFVEYPIANPSIMVRKELYDQHGVYASGDFPEDYEFFLRLQAQGVNMHKINQTVLEWSDLPNRLTRSHASYTHEAFFKLKAVYLARWLHIHNPFHPHVLVWGASRVSRRRSGWLKLYGISIARYIDLRQSDHVVGYKQIQSPSQGFILSYVSNPEARYEIRTYLREKGFIEGNHFWMCA